LGQVAPAKPSETDVAEHCCGPAVLLVRKQVVLRGLIVVAAAVQLRLRVTGLLLPAKISA
jgi:hypothetical protein